MAENPDIVDTTKPEAIVPDTGLGCAFSAFAHVLDCPKRLEIGEMEALPLLNRVRQIKGCARFDVVDVPALAPVVFPAHAGLESSFNPSNQEMPLASKDFADSECCFAAGSHECIVHSSPIIDQHSEDRICLFPCAISGHMSISHLDALCILLAGFGVEFSSIFSSPFPRFGFYMLCIPGLPFSKVLASLSWVGFSPAFILCREFPWIFLAITLLSQAAEFKFAFWRTYSLRNAIDSSSFGFLRPVLCSGFFKIVYSPFSRVLTYLFAMFSLITFLIRFHYESYRLTLGII